MSLRAPLTFAPRFQQYIWGGRKLADVLGRSIPDGAVAESWEISAHPAAPTVVDSGPLAGRSLPELVEEYGTALVGSRGRWAVERGAFPLLVKLLDASRALSVQVHPDDAYARVHEGGELGKTEMWYVLAARDGAEVIRGLRDGVTPEALRKALSEDRIEDCLQRVGVTRGDAVLIEAGTVHAILDGVLLAEIQQSSNATYRIHDWGRVGADGAPRELHLEKALDVIDFEARGVGVQKPDTVFDDGDVRREVLARCDKFVVERVSLDEGATLRGALEGETFEVWGVLSGNATLGGVGDRVSLEGVRFALLPATMGPWELHAESEVEALRAFLPAPESVGGPSPGGDGD